MGDQTPAPKGEQEEEPPCRLTSPSPKQVPWRWPEPSSPDMFSLEALLISTQWAAQHLLNWGSSWLALPLLFRVSAWGRVWPKVTSPGRAQMSQALTWPLAPLPTYVAPHLLGLSQFQVCSSRPLLHRSCDRSTSCRKLVARVCGLL